MTLKMWVMPRCFSSFGDSAIARLPTNRVFDSISEILGDAMAGDPRRLLLNHCLEAAKSTEVRRGYS